MTRLPLIFSTATVAASPADASETVVAILNGVTCQFAGDTFKLHGFVAIDPDGDATFATLRIRRGSLAGDQAGADATVFAAGGSIDVADTPGDVVNAVYVLTLEMQNASGPSTVTDTALNARCD